MSRDAPGPRGCRGGEGALSRSFLGAPSSTLLVAASRRTFQCDRQLLAVPDCASLQSAQTER